MMPKFLTTLWTTVLETLFPLRCAACRRTILDDTGFCDACAETLVSGLEAACPRCGVVYLGPPYVEGGHVCGACSRDPPPFSRARGAYAYGGAMQEAIAAWKNRPDEPVGRGLTRLFDAAVADLEMPSGPDVVIVPIPSSARALRRRGFNPAAALARPLAKRLAATYAPTALTIEAAPRSSRGLSRAARAARMRGVFAARRNRVSGREVILVDDVMTTGATLRAASRACLRAGASAVECLVLARVPA